MIWVIPAKAGTGEPARPFPVGGDWDVAHYATLADDALSSPRTRGQGFSDSVEPLAPTPRFSKARRTSPARAAAVDSDVLVPLSQAFISSMVVGIATTGVAIVAHWPAYVVPLAAGGTFCVAWFVLLADHRFLLRVVEEIVNTDLDRDGHVGRPEPPPPPIEAEISYYDEKGLRKRMQYLDVIPGEVLRATSFEGIQDFAKAALAGEPLTETDWTGQGRPFSLRRFRVMMQTLERSELVERAGKGSTATRSLTLAGRAVFRKMVK